jgi:hypothetical protein
MNIIDVTHYAKGERCIRRESWDEGTYLKCKKDSYGGMYFLICVKNSEYQTSFVFKVEDILAGDWEVI